MTSTPVIETARLRLRGHRYDDLADCTAMWSDPNVTALITGQPSTEQQTWTRLLAYVGHWAIMGFGYWVIEERRSGDFVGELGFADFKRAIDPSMKGIPEIGFALASRFHGNGYATEAVQAALAWADAELASDETVCLINEQNAASIRVAEKCGYEVFARKNYNDRPALFLSRRRVVVPENGSDLPASGN